MVKNTGRVMSKNLSRQAEMAYRGNSVENDLRSSGNISTETDLTFYTNEEYISL